MQIRCDKCTKTIALAPTGQLPPTCPHCAQAAVPKQLGAYVLDRLLATGGMGEVYLAHHAELATQVAIKLLPALPLDKIESVRQRFAREARLTSKVEHRGVVRVLNSDAVGDRPYLVLELVAGETLRQYADGAALAPSDAARIVAETADILAAAHAQGVLHRDIKPDNVMLEPDGTVRVLDFGIARAIADDTQLTQTGEIVGTPEYMAPEQLLEGPEATDARTDVHALGVLLYELLTGRSPFRSANLFQSLKLVESLVPKFDSGAAEPPTQLQLVVRRAIEKRPGDRHASAAELAAALRTAMPSIIATGPQGPRSKWPLRFGIAGSLFGVTALLFAAYITPDNDRRTSRPDPNRAAAPQLQSAAWTTEQLEQDLLSGNWCAALTDGEQALADGHQAARPLAQQALASSHAAWLRVAGLPPWLAAYDMHRRERLFGDLLEPSADLNPEWSQVLSGQEAAWRAVASQEGDSLLTQLIDIASQPANIRRDRLQGIAQRLPIEQPEHWLAQTIVRHLRKDRAGAEQAAEMAWLTGAGELAVLLDAALAMPTADASQRAALWRRIAKADREDCPASTLLLLQLQTRGTGNATFEPSVAHAFPTTHRPNAASWFLAQANLATERQRLMLLRISVALGATPNFNEAPWDRVPRDQRPRLERDQQRAK